MGVLKFRIHPPDRVSRLPYLRMGYMTGLDRTPSRSTVEVRPGLLTCHRENPESGRFHVPWPVEGFGVPFVGTATLAERSEPYDLAVELARGRLNEVRNQTSDWVLMGLQPPPDLGLRLGESQHWLAQAVTSRSDPERATMAAGRCLTTAFEASDLLIRSYTEQVLRRRRELAPRLPTLLSCSLEGDPKRWPAAATLAPCLNAGRISCNWGRLAPQESQLRWDEFDAQLAWCRTHKLLPSAGPLVDLRPGSLPDWLWLWGGDFEEIQSMVEDVVRQTLSRYRGKVSIWHLIHRAGIGEILGLNEEEQIRLTARVLQVARSVDPQAQLVIDFERPWAGWLSSSPFQLGPLHLADSLARAELGLSGVGVEIALGYGPPGSHLHDLLDASRLLDQYALVNLPLHVSFAIPSSGAPDPKADAAVSLEAGAWPTSPTESLQYEWASKWIALAAAKPFVRAIHWAQPGDGFPHLFPNAGLFRADNTPKPIVEWLRTFRAQSLEPPAR